MATKADFNADEWATVVEGPLLAGVRVVTSGRGGAIRESLAIGRVYGEARKAEGKSELVDELVSTPPAMDPQRIQGMGGDISQAATARVREAVELVERKAPDEADAYREFVVAVARAAAEAHKEGGFIGIGGKQVSDEEQAALDEIQSALGGTNGGAA